MTAPPDPSSIDWETVALWAAGIGTGIGSMVGATMLAIRRALKVARENPTTTITREETKVVTTDSVAMHPAAQTVIVGKPKPRKPSPVSTAPGTWNRIEGRWNE